MSFDFATALFVAALVTGFIWGLDRLVWARRRIAEGDSAEPLLVEYSRSFFPVIAIVLVLRSFVAEPFRIPSGSMLPTLFVGDFILVNKFAYGLRLPVIEKKIYEIGDPQRGDVVVFRYPPNPSIDYIKRVVGLPGDKIAYRQKRLFINGKKVDVSPLVGGENVAIDKRQFEEQLGDALHQIQITLSRPSLDGELIVPPGHYFVMGDNRDNSADSRVWGFVPDQNLLGKATFIWMSLDFGEMNFYPERVGTFID